MLAYLHILLVGFVTIGIACLVLLTAITADLVYYHFMGYKNEKAAQDRAKKDGIRDQKEAEAKATGLFFDEAWLGPYKPGFNNTGELYYRGRHLAGKHRLADIDSEVDAEIIEFFENTKDV